MGSLNSLYIKAETLKTLYDTLQKKTGKESNGISLTVSISDDANQYGQNVSVFVEQTKEQREAKKDRYYVGNGKTFWTDGTIKVPEKQEEAKKEAETTSSGDEEDLPF